MAALKTQRTEQKVSEFLDSIADENRRKECRTILEIMQRATGTEPRMWGPSIVGFGSYHYKYDSGREGDWFVTGFSPRKQNLTLYIMGGFPRHADLLTSLGKHKTGSSCLYIRKLSDIDLGVLTALVEAAVAHMAASGSLTSPGASHGG